MKSIKEIIYNHFVEYDSEKNQDRLETRIARLKETGLVHFHPSEMGMCGRALAWRYAGERESNPIEPSTRFKMKMGSCAHEAIQSILGDAGVFLEAPEELKFGKLGKLAWAYRLDGFIRLHDDNGLEERQICEIKTTYGAGWNSVETEPKKEHVYQLLSCMILENRSNGRLLYVGRDNGMLVEYEVTLNPPDSLLIAKRGAEQGVTSAPLLLKGFKEELAFMRSMEPVLIAAVKGQKFTVPPRRYKAYFKNMGDGRLNTEFQANNLKYKTDWQCSYCRHFDKCYAREMVDCRNGGKGAIVYGN